MAFQTPIHLALNYYDNTMHNNYNNVMIKTIIMSIVSDQVNKLNFIPGIHYESCMDDDNDYGLLVRLDNKNFPFQMYAKAYQIIHKNYNDTYIKQLPNSQESLVQECNFIDVYTSFGIIEPINYDITVEPFDATWKVYHDYKKQVSEHQHTNSKSFITSIKNKVNNVTKQDYDYYAKNTMTMINYICTILKAVIKVNDDIANRSSIYNWNNVPFDNFMVAYIMINLKSYLEKKGILVIIISDDTYNLLINGELELAYDVQYNKINLKQKLTDGKMLIAIKDIHSFLMLYLAKKRLINNGFSYPKKK